MTQKELELEVSKRLSDLSNEIRIETTLISSCSDDFFVQVGFIHTKENNQ